MTDLTVANTLIRKNEQGLYCLNDLHKASGGAGSDSPKFWLMTKQAKQYIELLDLESQGKKSCLEVIHGGEYRGTYASKELVYSYAMWISVKFHHDVIQTYDAVVTGQIEMSQSDAEMLRITRINPNTLKAITGTRNNNAVRESYKALMDAELLEEHTKIIFKRVYLPTAKGLDYVTSSHHGIMRFNPEYHDLIVDAVNEYRAQLSNDNMDLFLESSINHSHSD